MDEGRRDNNSGRIDLGRKTCVQGTRSLLWGDIMSFQETNFNTDKAGQALSAYLGKEVSYPSWFSQCSEEWFGDQLVAKSVRDDCSAQQEETVVRFKWIS